MQVRPLPKAAPIRLGVTTDPTINELVARRADVVKDALNPTTKHPQGTPLKGVGLGVPSVAAPLAAVDLTTL